MRYDFVVIIRRDLDRRAELAGFCLLFFSFIGFLLSWIRSDFVLTALAPFSLAMLAGLVINGIRARKKKDIRFHYWLLAAAAGWAFMPYAQWILVIFLLFAFGESQARKPLEIGFAAEAVFVTSFLKRRIAWRELQSVILKDGLLTLDFKNNRLLQREVPEDGARGVSEDEFNVFCRQQLALTDDR